MVGRIGWLRVGDEFDDFAGELGGSRFLAEQAFRDRLCLHLLWFLLASRVKFWPEDKEIWKKRNIFRPCESETDWKCKHRAQVLIRTDSSLLHGGMQDTTHTGVSQ